MSTNNHKGAPEQLLELERSAQRMRDAVYYAANFLDRKTFSIGQLSFLFFVREAGAQGRSMTELLEDMGKQPEEHDYISRNTGALSSPKAKGQPLVNYKVAPIQRRRRIVMLTELGADLLDKVILILNGNASYSYGSGDLKISAAGKKQLTMLKANRSL